MRQKIIAGNWKMNGNLIETESLLKALVSEGFNDDNVKVVVCPPYTSLPLAVQLTRSSAIAVGAQDMSEHPKGAYTGEISADMLLTAGVVYVILGHSERRQYHGETDKLVNVKAKAALEAGLTPIICVGETLQQREAGQTETVVGAQIDGTLLGFSADLISKSVVAYEPVWAIGTGRTATPEMAQAVHKFIRGRVAKMDKKAAETLPILYGGSVKPDNAAGLLSQPDIDGALVGGASLKAADFTAIINAA
ncbi:MAG: triose-phosphate isomerase [candidate division Zixibacteria bacterium]|nr:triose-phosphate isomerase [candidate division Zixibacteria bacterium]